MEEFLKTLVGKKIDAFCGGTSSVRGEVVKVENGVLHLKLAKHESAKPRKISVKAE